MIEKKFIEQKMNEHRVKQYIQEKMKGVGLSKIELEKTPLGMKVIIHTSKPGLIIGRRGANISELTEDLRTKFKLDSPQLEVKEIKVPELDPQIMAEQITLQLAKFGVTRFKTIGYRMVRAIMNAGAVGVEIKIAGKVPGRRSTFWRFKEGYLPKCGHIAVEKVRKGFETANLKPGVIGVSVSILTKDVRMPDHIEFKSEIEERKATKEEIGELEEQVKEKGDENSDSKTKRPGKSKQK